MKKTVRWILVAFFGVIFVFSGGKVAQALLEYRAGEVSYAALEQYVSLTPPQTGAAGEKTAQDTQPDQQPRQEDTTVWPEVDFAQLRQINPDIVGWIYIEGTNISYPVAQGQDNSYYLNHLFDGSVNSAGCIFLDSRCSGDFSDRNSVIYGHHMGNGTMFNALDEYTDQSFYEAHPTVLLLTPEGNYKIQIFSCYVSDTSASAWRTDLSEADMEQWLAEVAGRSAITPAQQPAGTDRVVTLSTCSYEFSGARLVVHGFIHEDTEE